MTGPSEALTIPETCAEFAHRPHETVRGDKRGAACRAQIRKKNDHLAQRLAPISKRTAVRDEARGPPRWLCSQGRRTVTGTIALSGLRVRLERTTDQPCAACGGTTVVIDEGAGSQAASLRCAGCDRHRGGLPQEIVKFLSEVVRLFGIPAEPLLLKDASHSKQGIAMKRSELFPSRFLPTRRSPKPPANCCHQRGHTRRRRR